jgi:hypothetical protein
MLLHVCCLLTKDTVRLLAFEYCSSLILLCRVSLKAQLATTKRGRQPGTRRDNQQVQSAALAKAAIDPCKPASSRGSVNQVLQQKLLRRHNNGRLSGLSCRGDPTNAGRLQAPSVRKLAAHTQRNLKRLRSQAGGGSVRLCLRTNR